MTFTQNTKRSNAQSIVLFEVDTLLENTQWVNVGAGVWCVYYDASYPWVDPSLLTGYTVQDFGVVGSVMVDYQQQTQVASLLLVSSTQESWYFDATNEILYIHLVNSDAPNMHSIFIGKANGYAFSAIVPEGSTSYYDGRLLRVPDLGRERDPMFFGKLVYPSAQIELINGDGYFDTFAEDNNIYGNPGRIKLGYAGLDLADYKILFSGYIERTDISDETFSLALTDKRKQLTKPFPYSVVAENPITAIKSILDQAYGIKYAAGYFDITSFDTAEAYATANNLTVSIYRTDDDRLKNVAELIEEICQSVWGIFDVTDEGLFTFKFITETGTPEWIIPKTDFINSQLSISYDPAEVVSSVRVGHTRDWGDDSYTYYTNTTREASVFAKYKTYNQQTFDTLLAGASVSDAAIGMASRILDYADTVKGLVEIDVPMRYYGIEVGDFAAVQLDRLGTEMLGWQSCEVLAVLYNLELPSIKLKLRITQTEVVYLVTEAGEYVATEDGYKIVSYG